MFRYIPRTALALSLAATVNVACGDDDPDTPDTGPVDTGSVDTGMPDMGVMPDMGPADTGAVACTTAGVLTANDIDCSGATCNVPAGNYAGAVAFNQAKTYVLAGRVFMGDGTAGACAAQLTISAGTLVVSARADSGYLAILPNSTIDAQGTAASPIVFTSAEAVPARGDYGGIIISGNATVNCGGAGVTCNGEGDTGAYGGTDDAESSGTMRYVVIAYGGNRVNATDELNGLALQGVGSGTTIEHIHIHKSGDDGIEFFGGTVNAKWLIITGIGDDSIDWTFGWRGNLQYAVVQQHPDASDNGIEADNDGRDTGNPDGTPRSNPILSNLTMIGSPGSDSSDIGMLLRAGTGGQIWSSVVAEFNDAGLDVDDMATFTNATAAAGNLAVAYNTLCNATNFKEDGDGTFTIADFYADAGGMFGSVNNRTSPQPCVNLGFNRAALLNITAPNFVPTATAGMAGGALEGGQAPSNAFFEPTTYRGAVEPGIMPANAWYAWADFTL